MADINTLLKPRVTNMLKEVYAFLWSTSFAVPATGVLNTDRIRLVEVTRNMRGINAVLAVSATLGATVTLQLQRDRAGVYTNITTATTAGAAGIANATTLGCFDLDVGDFVVALVGGANVSAAATVLLDLLVQTD